MTDEELNGLNAWLARQVFDLEVRYSNKVPYIRVAGTVRPVCYHSDAFAEIKREIERRGWPWQCHCYLTEANGQTIKSYSFRIYDTEEHEQYTAHPVLANGVGVTEELAGCRAMKAAVEATNESP